MLRGINHNQNDKLGALNKSAMNSRNNATITSVNIAMLIHMVIHSIKTLAASLSFSGKTIAPSYLRHATTARMLPIDVNRLNTPKSEGL